MKEPAHGELAFVCEALCGYWGSEEVLEMHTMCKGKRDVEGGPLIHTTLLERKARVSRPATRQIERESLP
jgi:hypothetical protein